MTAEVRHQGEKFGVAACGDETRNVALVADLVVEALPEGGAALKAERGIEQVGAGVDPGAELVAAGFAERRLHGLAVLQDDDVPAEIAEHGLELFPQALGHDGVEALAVVVDDPPGIAQALLPALDQGFVDVAFVHFGVADEGDHAALLAVGGEPVRLDVVLGQRRKDGLRRAEADGAGREIDVVAVFGARGIRLRAAEGAEGFELVARLLAEQVLDGVEDRARMRLHRDAVGQAGAPRR